jgi:hypothetical protein
MTTQLTQCSKCGRHGWHTTERCPELASNPLPADATDADQWQVGEDDERVTRVFTGTKRGTDVRVTIYGEQDHSGAVLNRLISVSPSGHSGTAEVGAAGARQIAADLLAAADELDQLAAGG